ncbi:MAG TPA: class I SAM-dependent methyltransferase, partial [Pirellulales bacterium]|nr:class I SAM-dependent methyltransferase [Pirellulales bacterium]
ACTSCGLVYYPRRLAPGEAERLYSSEYFQGAEYFDYWNDRAIHEANFRRRVRQLARWLPEGSHVFEIGCSYGLFLHLARQRWTVRGCDIAAEPCRTAREGFGLDVRCADFFDVPLARGEIDAFCLWDTIEHLDAPDEYLARMAELLLPGGIVALTTGDIGSWLARRQGPRWRQIHPPTHLWYFSLATMRSTLARYGFEFVWSRHVGMARSLGQIVYSLTSLGKSAPSLPHRLCVRTGLARIPIWLNTYDLMMVVARRKGNAPPAAAREAA